MTQETTSILLEKPSILGTAGADPRYGPTQIFLPKIPREYFDRSPVRTTVFLTYALSLWVLPAGLIYRLSHTTGLSSGKKALLVVVLALVAQQGLHLLGWIGHEAFHFNLFSGRRINCLTGLLFSSMIFGHNGFGFALSHWHHHRFTNEDDDPDKKIYERFHSAWSRFFLARLAADLQYVQNGVRAATGHWNTCVKGFPFSQKEIRAFGSANLLLSAFWAVIYGEIIARRPVPGLLSIVLPLLLVTLFTGLRPYLEHAGTSRGLFLNSRSRTSPLLSAVYFFNNYHLEHHLYPRIPCYNLPKVHAYLKSMGILAREGAFVDERFLSNIRYATGGYQYS